MEIFCNIIIVFAVALDQFIEFLLNTIFNFFKKSKCDLWPQTFEWKFNFCSIWCFQIHIYLINMLFI